MKQAIAAGIAAASLVAFNAQAQSSRDVISVVGSSTVYPFSTVVAERFGKTTNFKTPKVESTGSGGGLKLFCAGVGVAHPDITNASRRIKKSEVETCAKNGVNDILEIKIGYDGIVFANSKKSPQMSISRQDIFLALAHDVPKGDQESTVANKAMKWSDVNADLPATKIEVLGPPPTSGTRDAFAELALEGGCKSFGWIKGMGKKDKKGYKKLCHTVREDGAYIEAGENDNLIVQKLEANPNAFGVFGYSFLDQNSDKLQGSVVDGVEPTFENIADGKYPVSRPLYFYVKKAHIGKVPGIKEFVDAFVSEQTIGDEGYLTDRGLIPMPTEERAKFQADAKNLTNLKLASN